MKKKYITIIAILTIIAFISYRAYNTYYYKQNAEKLLNTIASLTLLSDQITTKYIDIWQKQIDAGWGGYIYIDGKYRYFASVEDAINYEKNKLIRSNMIKLFDENYSLFLKESKNINKYPNNIKEIKEKMIDLYLDVKEYSILTETPNGSLVSYSQNTNYLSNQIDRKFEELTIMLKE